MWIDFIHYDLDSEKEEKEEKEEIEQCIKNFRGYNKEIYD